MSQPPRGNGGAAVPGAEYTALYRTWRSHRLADVVGQEHVVRTLRNALATGRTAHAYLFCGPRGSGKTSTARILAAALNCAHPVEGDACGECPACRDVAADRLIDVREIDAASNRQVEDMRALRETVAYAPVSGRHKVYILDEVHMLTEASWNTLLKTLEEPPPATTFVLCTTDPRKVLPTVVSRCQRFDFRRHSVAEIEAHLARVCVGEGIAAEPAALQTIARRSEGGMRDALSILDQAAAFVPAGPITAEAVTDMLGVADETAVGELLAAARAGDVGAVLTAVERLYAAGKDMGQVLRDVLAGMRDRLVARLSGRGVSAGGAEVRWLLDAIDMLADAEGRLRRAEQGRLLLETALIRIVAGDRAGPAGSPAPDPGRPSAVRTPASTPAAPVTPAARVEVPAPAAPPPAAASVRAGSPPDSGVRPWDVFLEALRRQSVLAGSAFQAGEFRGLHDGVVQVAFRYPTHVVVAERHHAVAERVWAEVHGSAVRFECAATSEPVAPRRAGTARPAAGVTRGDDAAFGRALALFQGTEVP